MLNTKGQWYLNNYSKLLYVGVGPKLAGGNYTNG